MYRSLCCQNYEIRNRDLNLYKYFLHNWLSFSCVIQRSIINQKFVKMTSISIKYKEKIRLSIDFMITCYIYSGSLHIRSYCVRSPWYWISVTRLVFYLYCVNFVIYWKYFVSDILRLHMTFMTLGSFCLVVKMKIFTVIHILTQENWKKVYIFDHCVHYRLQNS